MHSGRARTLSIHRATLCTAALVLVIARGELAAQPPPGTPHAHSTAGADGQVLCPTCPAARESSGTNWQPDATDAPLHDLSAGRWRLRIHGQAALVQTYERGPRGGTEAFAPNHITFAARTAALGGVVGVQSMWSFEPSMGAAGYPLLTQTGETADGVTPLIDRQHPHDLPMELAATYSRAIDAERSFYVYVAAAGAPALGPPAYMHRASADRLPIAPITHYWFDSTHITFGVVTAGFVPTPREARSIGVQRARARRASLGV